MSTTITNSTAEVIQILTKKGKHRGTNPFVQELSRFLRDPQATQYYFLSEDYYHSILHRTNNPVKPFELVIGSSKPEIVARSEEVNYDLSRVKI